MRKRCRSSALALALGLAVLAGLSLPVTPAAAKDGDVQAMKLLSRIFEGLPHRVAFAAPYAYVALDTGVAIYDLSTPKTPVRVSHLYLPSAAYDLEVQGNRVYVADGESGLQVLDVADPTKPIVAGSLATAGTRAVTVVGTVAYLAEASDPPATVFGLRTIDVSLPASPTPLGFLPLPNGALDVAVAGGVAFVGTGSDLGKPHGFYAVDVSTPAAPKLVPGGSLNAGLAVNEIQLQSGLAYLAIGLPSTGEIAIIDVSTPSAPVVRSVVPLSDGARGLALAGTTLYVAARSLGLLTLDVSSATAPVMLDALPTGRESVAVATLPGFALLAERASIEQAALTVADATFPSAVRVASVVPFAEATAVAAAPGLACFLERDALHIDDATDPTALVPLGVWRPPQGDFSSLDLEGSLAAVGEGTVVHLVDLTDPANPASRGDANLSQGVAVRPVLAGNTLYVVNGRGFESFDVTSPSAPVPLASFSTPGWSSALAVDGKTGYLAAGDTVHVVDLSASLLPVEIGSATIAGEQLYGVAAKSPLAVATGLDATLYAFDVTSPAAIKLAGTLGGPGGFYIRLAGDRAVIAAGTAGIRSVNVSVPAAPALEGLYDTSGAALWLALDGKSVYLSTNEAQQWAVRCDTCPSNVCVDTWPTLKDNTLKLVKVPVNQTLSWELLSGAGSWNLHRTLAKTALPLLYQDVTTFIGQSPTLGYSDVFAPAVGACGYYKVYPRSSCSGLSVGP